MTDILNQDNIYLNENRNYRFNRIPLITPNLSKIMKNRLKNNLMQRKTFKEVEINYSLISKGIQLITLITIH